MRQRTRKYRTSGQVKHYGGASIHRGQGLGSDLDWLPTTNISPMFWTTCLLNVHLHKSLSPILKPIHKFMKTRPFKVG